MLISNSKREQVIDSLLDMEHSTKTDMLLPYYVVEFINRGRKPQIKKVDIVVSSWMSINEKTKKIMTRFPHPPYDHLSIYLENKLEAPSTWPNYPVRIRGKAVTLKEAETKMKQLNEAESALTLSSDENISEAEKNVTDTLKENLFLEKAKKFKSKVSKELNKDEKKYNELINLMQDENESDDESSNTNSITKKNDESKISNPRSPNKTTVQTVFKQSFTEMELQTNTCSNLAGTYDTKTKYDNVPSTSTSQSMINNNLIHKKAKCSCQEIIIDNLSLILNTLKDLKSEVKCHSMEIGSLKAMLSQNCAISSSKFVGNTKQLSMKYGYIIPFENFAEFKKFDAELLDNKSDLIKDIKPILLSGLDGSLVISKSIVNILKMFLNKKIAMQFTATKKITDKEVMKKTNFYAVMEGIIKEQRIRTNLTATDKDFSTALSNVLTNAVGWKSIENSKVLESINNAEIKNDANTKQNIEHSFECVFVDQEILNHAENEEVDNELLGTYNLLPIVSDSDFELNKI